MEFQVINSFCSSEMYMIFSLNLLMWLIALIDLADIGSVFHPWDEVKLHFYILSFYYSARFRLLIFFLESFVFVACNFSCLLSFSGFEKRIILTS